MRHSRYADLALDEAELIKSGRHVLCAYRMKPKAGNASGALAGARGFDPGPGTVSVAVRAVFLYRIASFWLPILPRCVAYAMLQRRESL